MAYYARMNGDTVVAVHAVHDSIDDGSTFLADLHGGAAAEWLQTFTDGTRGQQASIGDRYDAATDRFISPQEVQE